MTEQINGTPLAGEGNPENASSTFVSGQQNGGAQPGQEPKYLTEADAVALFNRLRDGIADSISMKTANRVKRVLTAAQQQGVQLTEAQAQSLIAEMDAQNEQQQTRPQVASREPTQAQQPTQSGQPESLHPVLLTAYSMMERAGVQLEDGDPELSLVDDKTTEEDVFLASIRQAINVKKARLSQAGSPARLPNIAAGGGTPASGGGKAQLTARLDKLLEHPQANWAEIKELREQLKQYN